MRLTEHLSRRVLTILAGLTAGLGMAALPGFVAPTLQLQAPAANEAGLRVRWTVPGDGWRFTVQSRDDLSAGAWTTPDPLSAWPQTLREWTDPRGAAAQRWYRVLAEPPSVARGEVISVNPIATFNTFLLGFLFAQAGAPITPVYNVDAFKIIYRTVDPYGLPTVASGVLALPAGLSRALPLVSYQHGTVLVKTDVPSSLNTEGAAALAFATDGYAAVAPDYLGLGDSPGLHPFHLARSEATAVVDLLRAARTVCANRAVNLNGQVFLLGYSQGGHATAAAQREIEGRHAAEFALTASAPLAGALDLSGTSFTDGLSSRVPPNPYYLAYLLAAYVEYYRFVPNYAAILRPPYATTIPPLFNGIATSAELNAALPPIPRDALRPEFLAALESDPQHPLRVALRENDLLDWVPQTPTRLYHCAGDRDVLAANSVVAHQRWTAAGAKDVRFIDPSPAADHGGCVYPSLLGTKAWFDSLRR